MPVKQKLTKTHVSRLPIPPAPPANCKDRRGYAVPCNKDLTDWAQALIGVINRQNAKLIEIEKVVEVENDGG